MLNLFKKQQPTLTSHKFKNLLISLPSHWVYELEEGNQEACFDPKSQSTLRLNVIELTAPQGINNEENIKVLTANHRYIVTANGYLLTDQVYKNSVENGCDITLITWRLINYKNEKKVMAVITYTVLSLEKDAKKEKEIISLIESSLQSSELV